MDDTSLRPRTRGISLVIEDPTSDSEGPRDRAQLLASEILD
jgi:hypothetical protein